MRKRNRWEDFKPVASSRRPSRNTPGRLLFTLMLVGVVGFGIGAGAISLLMASDPDDGRSMERREPPTFAQQHATWFVLAGGIVGAFSLMGMVWQYWPQDANDKSPWRFMGLGSGNRGRPVGKTHWSKINLPDWSWLPPRGTPGHLLVVLLIWCALGFLSGAGVTLLKIVWELDDVIEWGWPPRLEQPWVRWAVLAGGIVGAVLAVLTGWKRYPKDLD